MPRSLKNKLKQSQMDLKKLKKLGFGMQRSYSGEVNSNGRPPSPGSPTQSGSSTRGSQSSNVSRDSSLSRQYSNSSMLRSNCLDILNRMTKIYNKVRYHPNHPDNDHAYNHGFDTKRVFINILQTDPNYSQDYTTLQELANQFIEEQCNNLNNEVVNAFAVTARTVDDLIWVVYDRGARYRFD